METLLTPAHSTLEHIYDPEKAAELFVPGHTDVAITVSAAVPRPLLKVGVTTPIMMSSLY